MRGQVTIPAIAAVLTVAAMAYQARTVDPVLCEAPDVRLAEFAGYESEEEEVAEAERTVLPPDTQFAKRRYTNAEGHWFRVSAVIGGRSKSSIHRPELCLPAQGFQMTDPRTVTVGPVEWHLITLMRGDAPPTQVAYTFFNQAGFRTSSHLKRIFRDVWDRSILGRIDRWVMTEVTTSSGDEQTLVEFLRNLEGVVVR